MNSLAKKVYSVVCEVFLNLSECLVVSLGQEDQDKEDCGEGDSREEPQDTVQTAQELWEEGVDLDHRGHEESSQGTDETSSHPSDLQRKDFCSHGPGDADHATDTDAKVQQETSRWDKVCFHCP